MHNLLLYRAISKILNISYRSKLLLVTFLGTQAPLLVFACYVARRTSPTGAIEFRALVISITLTVLGSLFTLVILHHLLRPILLTASSLKRYAQDGVLPELPTEFTDEAGTLMSETQQTVLKLDAGLRRLTDFDQVTGLPTRKAFMDILNEGNFAGQSFALCAIQLCNFSRFASAFGQSSAYSALGALAKRFKAILGEGVPLSRAAFNTFVFAINLAEDRDQLGSHIEAIRLAAEAELFLPEFSLSLRPEMNAGVSIHREGPFDAELLINQAIAAAGGTYIESATHTSFFSPVQNEQDRDVFLLERDIRIALEAEQFSVHYQPIVDTSLGKVVGAEALVRWHHPQRGMVSPMTFIPVAEASGLMDAIGMRVLQQVCRQLGAWAGTSLQDVKVSINLSARQFLNPDAISQIVDALAANQVSPRNLEIELTETTVIQDTQRTLAILRVLREMGITIAIDDFGTGYSGLSYLKTLPFDRLKIDREFIQNVDQTITSKAICKSLIELASGLGIEVLAEGTETAAEVGMMRSLGCGLYQGYHLAVPFPRNNFSSRSCLLNRTSTSSVPHCLT